VTGVGAGDDKTWTFVPQLNTGIPTIDTATIEYLRSDGSTNHFYAEAGHAMTSSFGIEWAFNQPAMLSWDMFARTRQSGTPTGALVEYPSREILISNLLAVYLDPVWADLGTTQLTGVMRSTSFECETGFAPNYTMDARADADMTDYQVGILAATLSVTMELDAVSSARLAEYRTNSLVFIRLLQTGTLVDAEARSVQIDGCYRFTGPPSFSEDTQQGLVSFELEAVRDATTDSALEFEVVNGLAAV
jgi:hypothetical protein